MFVCGAIARTSDGHRDHGAGGVGARAGRRDVDDDGDVGGEDPLDDLPHRGAEPARRVHLDRDRRVAVALGPLDRVEQVVLRDRVHVVLELGDEDAFGVLPSVPLRAGPETISAVPARRLRALPTEEGNAATSRKDSINAGPFLLRAKGSPATFRWLRHEVSRRHSSRSPPSSRQPHGVSRRRSCSATSRSARPARSPPVRRPSGSTSSACTGRARAPCASACGRSAGAGANGSTLHPRRRISRTLGTAERARTRRWRLGNPWWVGDVRPHRVPDGRGRVTRLRAFFVRSPSAAIPLRALQKAGAPPIVSRAGWGADESIRRAAPRYAPSVRVAVVHHTAGSNGYTAAESAAIVRGIQVYHVKGNGWNDIGYNFLVDKYGKVFEGRYGGIDRNVIGAHAEGFNTGSVGVAVLGEYSSLAVAAKAQEALAQAARVAARPRPRRAGLDRCRTPRAATARFAPGTPVFLRAVSGHRDTGFTDCPGRALYALLGDITGDVAELGLPKLYAPVVTGAVPGSVRFRARLSAALDWTIDVTDSRGATVASTTGYGQAVDWTWPASGLPAGRYSYAIRAPDVTPALGHDRRRRARPRGNARVSGLAAEPATLTPNDDGADDTTTISYTLSAPAVVTVTVSDCARPGRGAAVAGLAAGGRARRCAIDGVNLPDGVYNVEIEAQATGGRIAVGLGAGHGDARRSARSPPTGRRSRRTATAARTRSPSRSGCRRPPRFASVFCATGSGSRRRSPGRSSRHPPCRRGTARSGSGGRATVSTRRSSRRPTSFTTLSLVVPVALDTRRAEDPDRAAVRPSALGVASPCASSLRVGARSFKRDARGRRRVARVGAAARAHPHRCVGRRRQRERPRVPTVAAVA